MSENYKELDKKTRTKKGKITSRHPVLTSLIVSITANVIIIVLLAIFGGLRNDVLYLIHEVPKKIDTIDSSLKNINYYVQRTENKEGFKPINAGIIFNREVKTPLPKDQVIIVNQKNTPFIEIEKMIGKYIWVKSNLREMPVVTRLLITRISENETDISKGVDIFINEDTARLFTNNVNTGQCYLEFKEITNNENK